MQIGNLRLQGREIAVVRKHVVSLCQTLLTRCLGRQNGADIRLREAVARNHTADLQAFRAVDNDDAVAAFAIGSGLDQKRDGQNHVGGNGLATAFAGKFANHRVQDSLQPPPHRRVGKGQPAHPAPVEGSVGRRNVPAELGTQRRHCRPVGGGQHPLGGFRLGRLAVSQALQGYGLGGQLLVAAVRRCILVSAQVGGTLLVIDAKDQRAAAWYKAYGALEIPKLPLSLVLPYSVVLKALQCSNPSER